jgi:hypothetical protein
MTQFSSDQLAKQYLQDFLEPVGTVERSFEIPGEAKHADIWFVPNQDTFLLQDLGLLGRLLTTPCILEPFSGGPSRQEVKTCLLKLLWMQEDQRRRQVPTDNLARLWILASRMDMPVIHDFGGQPVPDWPQGVYFTAPELNTVFVVINQLPVTPETLWIRLLGRGKTLEEAITELLTLPKDDNRRAQALKLLTNWRVSLQLKNPQEEEERELMATLSQAYLEWEQRTRAEGEQRGIALGEQRGIALGEQRGIALGEQRGAQREAVALLLGQLTHRFGTLPPAVAAQLEQLSLERLKMLSVAWLDFQGLADLDTWLQGD